MVEFVSYDGSYPNLCAGTLILRINGEEVIFPRFSLHSGGCVYLDDEYREHVLHDEWKVDIPEGFEEYTKEIEECVNENVESGCCGGCV